MCITRVNEIRLSIIEVSKGAKIRNRYNQVPHLTQDTNGKVTNSQSTPQTRAKRSALSQQVTTKQYINVIANLFIMGNYFNELKFGGYTILQTCTSQYLHPIYYGILCFRVSHFFASLLNGN